MSSGAINSVTDGAILEARMGVRRPLRGSGERQTTGARAQSTGMGLQSGHCVVLGCGRVLLADRRDHVFGNQIKGPTIPLREFAITPAVEGDDHIQLRNDDYDLAAITSCRK